VKKKEIVEIMVVKLKKELLFNYSYYQTLGGIQILYNKYIEKYEDRKQYQNMKRNILNSLYTELCTEKSYKILFNENEDFSSYNHLINLLEDRSKML